MRVSLLALVVLLAACRDITRPGCAPTGAAPLATPLSFVADVDSARFSPLIVTPAGGTMAEYAFWVTVRPKATPDTWLYTRPATPVFARTSLGLEPTAACAVNVGDVLEVWRDSTDYGYADGPSGRTWSYYPTQLIIRR